jgi:hypothetical protein
MRFTQLGMLVKSMLVPLVEATDVPRTIFCVDDHTDPSAVNSTLPAEPTDVRLVPPLAMGKVPVTPVVKGKPVTLVSVPLEGVPSAPPLTTNAPDDPTFTARAVATLVPRPDTPVDIGKPVALVNVAETGVPRAVTLPDALSCGDREAAIVSITFLVPAENVTAAPPFEDE